jgi:hypothetical protein
MMPALASEDSASITLDVLVDNDYDDSVASLQQIRDLLKLGFVEQVRVPSKLSIEQYMIDRYKFGPSQLPKTFALILSAIRDQNAGRDHSDSWLVPSLPRRRFEELNRSNPYYDFPRVARFTATQQTINGLVFVQDALTEDGSRRGSRRTLLHYTMSKAWYDALPIATKRLPIITGVSDQLLEIVVPKGVRLSTPTNDSAVASVLVSEAPQLSSEIYSPSSIIRSDELLESTAETAKRLVSRTTETIAPTLDWDMAEQSIAPAPLQDTSPSTPERNLVPLSASEILPRVATITTSPSSTLSPSAGRELFNASLHLDAQLAARKHTVYLLILDDGWPNATEMQAALSLVERALNYRHLRVASVSLPAPSNVNYVNHAAEIQMAFAGLPDPHSALNIVYIPVVLTPATEELMRQLFIFDYLARYSPQNFTAKPSQPNPLEPEAIKQADQDIAAWRAAASLWHETGRFNTQGPILAAIYRLAEALTLAEQTVFIVNQSWTITGDILSFAPTGRSLTVTAAGDDGVDVLAQHLDFAQRSATDDAFLTVMYVDAADHPDCGSGLVTRTDTVRVVAFDGELPNGKCGTSFAAPRVAWCIATKASQVDAFTVDWQRRIQQQLRSIRRGGTTWHDIYFDVGRFFQP